MSHTGLNISKLDKSKTKFKAIEINKVYKGSTVESQKISGSTRQHGGLQVLGKVGPTRRMPPPVHLPSLKSEHGFSDPVSLVPTGGSGWGGNSKEEDKTGNGASTTPVFTTSSSPSTSKSGVKESINGANSSSGQLWSNITSGKQGLMNKKQFQEDFPELAANPEDKVHSSPKKDDVTDLRAPLGPCLKPQNMLSWREGGGRKHVVDEDEEKKETSDHNKLRPSGSSEDDEADDRKRLQRSEFGYPPMPPYMSSQAGIPPRLMKPPVMGQMMGRMPGSGGGHPPSHMMYGPMVPPQFMFHPRPGYGPPPPFPGYLPPPPRPHMPYPRSEQGFHHGMPPHMRMPPTNGGEAGPREVIVKDQSLKEFDKISLWEGGWASKVTEVDYSKKLEFSDDEDNTSQKPSSDVKPHQSPSKEGSNFKPMKIHYDADLFTFNSKAHGRERNQARDDNEQITDEFRSIGDWSDDFRGFRSDDQFKNPSKSLKSEDYYYEDVYDKEERYEAYQARTQNKPAQSWMRFAKKDREIQDFSEPTRSPKIGFEEYRPTDDRRYNSADSKRDKLKYEDRHDAKQFEGSSNGNSESPDQYEYSGDAKDYSTEEKASRHHDSTPEHNRLSSMTSFSKSPITSDKFEKPVKSSTDEEKTDKIAAAVSLKEKTSPFDKASAAVRHVCPPPITSKYARQEPPAPSRYISLKKMSRIVSSDSNTSQTFITSGRNIKNFPKQFDLEESLETASQSVDNGSSYGGRKNWADSIDEEEELELKKNVWENTSSKKNRSSHPEVFEDELIKQFQNDDLNKSGSQNRDPVNQPKFTPADDKLQISKDFKATSENYKEYSSKYLDRQRYDDKHSTRKQPAQEDQEDGYSRRNTTRAGNHSSLDMGYQEFTRSGVYNRSSHSQQFRRSNYHVLTSRKTNVSETNVTEKDKSDFESKQKSEHLSRSDSNPWRIAKNPESAREDNRDSANRERSEEAVFEDKHVKVESVKADEGAGDGVCKEVELHANLESLKEIHLPPVHHKVLMTESVWKTTDYKESYEDREMRNDEADAKEDIVGVTPAFKADQNKEKLQFVSQAKQKSESDQSPMEVTTIKSFPAVHQPPPNVWLNRQKQEQRKVEERPQLVKNVWKSKNENLQKNFPTYPVDSETKSTNKETSNLSQSGTPSANPAQKKPPALMDMLIAKPPTALLKESQLLSSGDILDSDWNSTDNLSYMGRRSERSGYSRTLRGSGNQRRKIGGDQPEGEGVKDDERDNKSRRGHPYRHGDSNRRNRGLTRGYKGRVEYEEENDQQDVGRFSDDRRRSKSGYSRGEARSLTSDRKLMPGSLRGRRRGNKTSISSGTGVTSNCAMNESDIGNEEWETASESSDVLQNTHSQRPSKSHKDDDDRLNKLNRQFTELHHENKDEAAVDDLHGRSKKNDGGYLGKNARIQPRYQSKRELVRKNSFTGKTKSSLEHMVDKVSLVNQKHLIAPNASVSSGIEKSRIESTTTASLNKFKQSKVENTETAKPKYEREKKDILATIDVNNYASVVVVDNHPEVSIDDPSFLFEKNEGFQEVTSRRTLKSKMKAAQQEEALKKAAEQQQAQAAAAQAKKLEKDAARSRPAGTTSIGDNKLQRNQKLLQTRSTRPKDPKRVGGPLTAGNLARKFSISEDDRNAVLPKIENWNNDMAKSIPPLVPSISHSQTSSTLASASVPATTTSLFSANSETTPAIGSFGVTPVSHHLCAQDGGMNTQTYQSMYSFPVENWEKQAKQDGISKTNAPLTPGGTSHIFSSMSMPISEWSGALLGSKQPVIPTLAGDQNGTLNMPTMDQRDHEAQHQSPRESSVEKMSLASSPKPTSCHDLQINENDAPSCEAQAVSLGVSVTGDEGRAVKKPEGSSSVRSQQGRSFESIDIHSSIFKYRQGEDSSDIKLDFAFDASLQAKIPEAEKKASDVGLSAGANLSVIAAGVNSSSIGCSVTSSTHLPRVEMMSASDEDLGYKLAQVKNVWDRESTINYEQGMVPGNHRNPLKHAAPVSSSISMDMSDKIRQQQASSYLSGLSASGNDRVVLSQVDSLDSSSVVSSNSHQQQTMSYADAEMTFKDSSVDTYLSEQPNVCKVKPQLQASLATRSLNQFSGVASPPTPAQQHLMITFGQGSYAFGSQLLTPDCGIGLPFGQHAYLAAPATQTPLLAPLAIASQPSLFLGHTPNVQSDMYGAAQYRNLFGLTQQPQQQQSTIVVSSATSTLMSTAIKNQHQQYSEYYSSGSKQANALSAFPYGQLLGNSSIMQQPSQIGLPYDTAQYSTLQPDPTIMPPSNSQIVGSHLVPQRNAALHGLSSSTYYPQTLLQQSCFQQQRSGSHLQGSFQQYQLSAAFNMQPVALSVATGNGTQLANATALNFQAQQPLANQSQLKHSAPPFKPSSQRLALSPNGQKFSASGMMNGSNLNKNSLLSYHLQQQQDQQNASMLSSSFLLQQNLPNNIGSGLSNHSISIPSQYQLFTQQQQQQLQQLQQTIQLHQQQQHNVPSGFLAQQQQQPSNYSCPPKDRYGMTSTINQQSKYPQSLTGPSQMQQKFEQFGCDNAMDSQQAPSNSLLQNKYQSCKTQHVDMSSSSVSCGSGDAASSKLSPTISSAAPASLTLPNAGNVTGQMCDATSNVSSTLATSASSPTSFKSSGIPAPAFPSSSGNKWTAGSGFAGNLNFQGNQQYQQHQSFAPPSDRFNYGYLYSAGPKSDISRDNSQSSRTSLGSKSVTVRNVGNKGETSGGGTFHPSLLKTGGNGNVGVASRAERSGSANFYSLNAKDIKDLQAEERKKAMMDIQSFLNPENKPPQKLLQNPQNSSSPTSYSTGDQEVIKSVKD